MKQKISEVIPGITVLQGGEDVKNWFLKNANLVLTNAALDKRSGLR